ncbi:MAG: rhodanese-like domain-containing protein [Acidobacteriota bacterium]
MKRLFSLFLAALATLAQDSSIRKITDADELEKFIKEQSNLFFLDVRDPKEIEELGSLKGYVNIPLADLEKRLSEVPKDKTILTA